MKTAKSSWLLSVRKFARKFGPGIITGASDDDPAGILTYLQAGVILGFSSLWTTLMTLPLMFTIQEMCGRIGWVTKKGLITLIRENHSRTFVYIIGGISAIVITINIGADLLAIGVVLERLILLPRLFGMMAAGAVILLGTIFFSYQNFAKVLKWLALSLVFYIITVLYIDIEWQEALLATISPQNFQWTTSSLALVVAIVGTTISPYLFFWQTEEEVEERSTRKAKSIDATDTKKEITDLREDTFVGMLFSNIVMWFLLLGASQLARIYGLGEITDFDQAALALKPLLGDAAFFVFSLGLIGTGLLAVPVLGGSVGYVLTETFGHHRDGFRWKFHQAKFFYGIIIASVVVGILLSFFGLDPVKLLITTGILYTVITPPLLFIILRLANNKKLLGNYTNKSLSNVVGWIALILISALTITYLFSLVAPRL